jgi:hypothetical protein
VLRAPVALERAGDHLRVGLAAGVTQRGERSGVALPSEDRSDDRQAGHPGDVAHDMGQLQVHLLEHFLNVLDVVGGVGHEHRAPT